MSKKQKAIADMTVAELEQLAAEFDRDFVIDETRPLDADDRAQWGKAKGRPGQRRAPKDAKRISVTMDPGLLSRADRLAKEKRVSRSSLIARGLQAVLAAENAQR